MPDLLLDGSSPFELVLSGQKAAEFGLTKAYRTEDYFNGTFQSKIENRWENNPLHG